MNRAAITICTITALLTAGCGPATLAVVAHIPPPLVEQLPLKIGLRVSDDFARQVTKEPVGEVQLGIELGAAQSAAFKRVAGAMFRDAVVLGND